MGGKPGSASKYHMEIHGYPKGTGECEDTSSEFVLNPVSQERAMACVQKGTDDEEGNYVAYTIQTYDHALRLDAVWAKYCKPKPDACSCTSLLSRVLQENPDVNKIKGSFDAKPMIAGCKCYLGSAARAGFKYVRLESEKEKCNEQKIFNLETYRQICAWYDKKNCADKKVPTPAEITKT